MFKLLMLRLQLGKWVVTWLEHAPNLEHTNNTCMVQLPLVDSAFE